MKNIVFIIIMVVFTTQMFSQVGINQSSPSATLEIRGESSGIPTIRIQPQVSPVGNSSGQLAMMDDKLYLYDASRSKWLSVENTLINFGLAGPADNQELEYVGDVEDSGPRMPYDGTIVHVSMNASGGQLNKGVWLYKNDVAIANDDVAIERDGFLELDATNSFINAQYNLDFNAGDSFRMVVGDEGVAINDLSVVFWIKWRKENP